MENVKVYNDLKITASYANLHQDLDITDYYLYKGTFSKRTNEGFYVQWHDGTAGGWTPASNAVITPIWVSSHVKSSVPALMPHCSTVC